MVLGAIPMTTVDLKIGIVVVQMVRVLVYRSLVQMTVQNKETVCIVQVALGQLNCHAI